MSDLDKYGNLKKGAGIGEPQAPRTPVKRKPGPVKPVTEPKLSDLGGAMTSGVASGLVEPMEDGSDENEDREEHPAAHGANRRYDGREAGAGGA